MADFVQQMGGTGWANVSTQFYQVDSSGTRSTSATTRKCSPGSGPTTATRSPRSPRRRRATPRARPTPTHNWPQEAARAAAHFGVKGADLVERQFHHHPAARLQRPERAELRLLRIPRLHARRRAGELLLRAPSTSSRGSPTRTCRTHWRSTPGGINVCGQSAVNYDSSNPRSASSTASRSSSVTRSRRRSPIPAPRARWGAPERQGLRRLVRHDRSQRERRQVRVGRREPAHAHRATAAHLWRARRHPGQRRNEVRGPGAVEQR